jgi:hypothetical protein
MDNGNLNAVSYHSADKPGGWMISANGKTDRILVDVNESVVLPSRKIYGHGVGGQ